MTREQIARTEDNTNQYENSDPKAWSTETQNALAASIEAGLKDKGDLTELAKSIEIPVVKGDTLGALVKPFFGQLKWDQKVNYLSDQVEGDDKPETLADAWVYEGQIVYFEDNTIVVADDPNYEKKESGADEDTTEDGTDANAGTAQPAPGTTPDTAKDAADTSAGNAQPAPGTTPDAQVEAAATAAAEKNKDEPEEVKEEKERTVSLADFKKRTPASQLRFLQNTPSSFQITEKYYDAALKTEGQKALDVFNLLNEKHSGKFAEFINKHLEDRSLRAPALQAVLESLDIWERLKGFDRTKNIDWDNWFFVDTFDDYDGGVTVDTEDGGWYVISNSELEPFNFTADDISDFLDDNLDYVKSKVAPDSGQQNTEATATATVDPNVPD